MVPAPQADRPQYSDGTAVPDTVDSSTAQWSRGVNPSTGVKGTEPAEPVPVITGFSPATLAASATGTVITATGTNLGGTSKFTVAGVDAVASTVVSETSATFKLPASGMTAGARAVVAVNPAGNSAPVNITLT